MANRLEVIKDRLQNDLVHCCSFKYPYLEPKHAFVG